jgi:hypothetical protein
LIRTSLATLLVVTALSGCTRLDGTSGGGAQSTDREHRQADAALARWAAAVKAGGGAQAFTPVGELTGQIGDWEEAVGGNNKAALNAGRVVATTPLPSDAPAESLIRWADGSTSPVRPVSATQALADIAAATAPDALEAYECRSALTGTKKVISGSDTVCKSESVR